MDETDPGMVNSSQESDEFFAVGAKLQFTRHVWKENDAFLESFWSQSKKRGLFTRV